MRWFLVLVIALTVGGGVLYQTGQLNTFLWRFDDPAIRACRMDLIENLKSPSSYKEVEVSFYPGTGTKVFIKYDADNSYGASIRDTAMCEWIYFDGAFHFRLPFSTEVEGLLSGLTRETRLSGPHLDPIPRQDTKLVPRFPDLALEACIKETMKPGSLPQVTSTYMLNFKIGEPRDYLIDVNFNSLKNDLGVPRKASCQVQASRDRSNAVTVKSKEAVYW